MKVIQLNPIKSLTATERLIVAILTKDINAFKSTNKQFIRNNQAYHTGHSRMNA